jgi:TolB-like protein/Tfp pilus assembly protein PilF
MSARPSFFDELKRRNVIRAAGLYLVGAWLLVQVAGTILPMFGAPDWLPRTIVILLAIGFVPALIFSWVFELTPQGLKRDEDVAPEQSIAPQTARRMDRLITVVLVLALGYFCFDKFILTPRREAAMIATASLPNEHKSPIPAKSIAVLPFDNLSRDPDNAYFSEGIQDEILTRLAKSAELKVVSRTSSERFKSSPSSVQDIARQLGVANILEGSVQKESNEVRVNVQLIKAASDEHLWADTYDRKLTDIFAVESEIARTVAGTLRAKLTGSAEQVLASRPTENPEAHQLYLEGRYFWNKRGPQNLQKSIGYFQQAIDLDPNYALAYAGLADAHAVLPVYAGTAPQDDIPQALAAAGKAVELDQSLAEAHTSLANALVMNVQLPQSEPEFRRALEMNPNYATAHQWFGECLFDEGRSTEAIAEFQRAHELDPLSLIMNADYGEALFESGRAQEAIDHLRRTLAFDPTFVPVLSTLGQIFEKQGKLSEAIAADEKVYALGSTPANAAILACAYAKVGRTAEARRILDSLTNLSRQHFVAAYPLAVIHLALGEKEEALRLLEKSLDERSLLLQGWFGSFKIDPRLDPLRGDPRFQKLEERFLNGDPQ